MSDVWVDDHPTLELPVVPAPAPVPQPTVVALTPVPYVQVQSAWRDLWSTCVGVLASVLRAVAILLRTAVRLAPMALIVGVLFLGARYVPWKGVGDFVQGSVDAVKRATDDGTRTSPRRVVYSTTTTETTIYWDAEYGGIKSRPAD